MTALRARSRWWWGMAVLVVALALPGCSAQPRPATPPATTPAADLVIVRATSVIATANDIYTTVMIESAQAYFNGELDEATYLQIKEVSRRVEQTLRATKAGVEVYNIVKSVDNAEGAETLLTSLDLVSKELRTLWEEVSDGE